MQKRFFGEHFRDSAFKGFNGIAPYVLPLVGFGIIFAAYQVAIQEIPDWQPINLFGTGPDCKVRTDIGSGPISIPMLSLVGFEYNVWITNFGLENKQTRSNRDFRVFRYDLMVTGCIQKFCFMLYSRQERANHKKL